MPSIRTLLALSFPLLLVTGCPDAEGEYDAFKDRFNELHPPGTAGAAGAPGDAGDAGACTPPKAGELDGDYLFTLSAVLDANKPLLFAAKVTTKDEGGQLTMRWTLQGLLWSDRKTLVGPTFDIPPTSEPAFALAADGSFNSKLPPLNVVGEASPFSHTPITADVVLKGKFCNTDGFYCGSAEGDVTKPVPIPLPGSTWTLEKLATAGAYTDPPYINCKKKIAIPTCCVDPKVPCTDEAKTVTEHCAKDGVCCKANAAACGDIQICK